MEIDYSKCIVARPGTGGSQLSQLFKMTRPQELLSIGDLIYPHRYDILVRSEFPPFYWKYRELARSDPKEFLELCREQLPDYYYNDMACFYRWMLWERGAQADMSTVDTLPNAIKRMITLVDSMAPVGVERAHWQYGLGPIKRIHVIRPRVVLPAVGGQAVTSRRGFLGNGQHRLSILYSLGARYLTPDQYMFLEYREYSPWVVSDLYADRPDFFRRAYKCEPL